MTNSGTVTNLGGQPTSTGTQWKHINSFLHNGCNYNGPKEGKSVMNNIRAAELDYNVRATSTRISMK